MSLSPDIFHCLLESGSLERLPGRALGADKTAPTLLASGTKPNARQGASSLNMMRRHFTALVGFTGRFPTPRLRDHALRDNPDICRTMLRAQGELTVPIGVGGATINNTAGLYAFEKWCSESANGQSGRLVFLEGAGQGVV